MILFGRIAQEGRGVSFGSATEVKVRLPASNIIGCLLLTFLATALAQAEGAAVGVKLKSPPRAQITVGINVINLLKLDPEKQDATLSDLKSAGVKVIRTGISPDDKGVDFAKRAFNQGIQIALIVGVQYRSDAPTRPWQPKEFPGQWSGHPLSYADPDAFRGNPTVSTADSCVDSAWVNIAGGALMRAATSS